MRLDNNPCSRRSVIKTAGTVGLAIGIAGCSGNNNSDGNGGNGGDNGNGGGGSSTPYSQENQEIVEGIDLNAIEPDGLIGLGSRDLEPSDPETVELSDDQISELEEMDATTGIVFHYLKTAWVRLQQNGLEAQFDEIGIEIDSVQGANFEARTQANLVETLSGNDGIDAITSRPLSADTTSSAFQAAADAGKELVFMDDIPSQLDHPEDFASMVAADNRALGVISGHIMGEFVGEGDVMMIGFANDVKSVNERESGFRQTIENEYEGIEIVEEVEFTDANNVQDMAQNIMTANPEAEGVWTAWDDPPGMQAVAAARESGKDPQEFHITTCDLGERSAQNMAEGGYIKGTGSQRPYDQGVSEANAIGQALLGNETPPYIAVPALAVTRENLLSAYETVFKSEPPEEITNQFE